MDARLGGADRLAASLILETMFESLEKQHDELLEDRILSPTALTDSAVREVHKKTFYPTHKSVNDILQQTLIASQHGHLRRSAHATPAHRTKPVDPTQALTLSAEQSDMCTVGQGNVGSVDDSLKNSFLQQLSASPHEVGQVPSVSPRLHPEHQKGPARDTNSRQRIPELEEELHDLFTHELATR